MIIDPAGTTSIPLPRNVASRDMLLRDRGVWGFSFYDAPERSMSETFIATVPNCRILSQFDRWGEPDGNEYYAIVTEDDRSLNVSGTRYEPEFHRLLLAAPSSNQGHLRKAAWVLELWDRNYAHWIEWMLVKIALLHRRGLTSHLLMPRAHRLAEVVHSSVAALGIDVAALPRMGPKVLHVDELTVVGIDYYRTSLVANLRDMLRVDSPRKVPSRRIFVSRANAQWRRLTNEDDCWAVLGRFGFERIFMEELGFQGQFDLMQEAAVFVGVHGAGMVNIMFAPKGLHVVEIFDPGFANPQYYALAGAIGHPYWLIRGTSVGEPNPGYNDLEVNVAELERIAERIDGELRRP
jgi:capsular polysaccharide biosynthesis protein